MRRVVSGFSIEILHVCNILEIVNVFQKINASNELDMFFLNKIEEDFLR